MFPNRCQPCPRAKHLTRVSIDLRMSLSHEDGWPGQARPRRVGCYCPTGKSAIWLSSPICKNISLHPSGKSSLQIRAIPPHQRGVSRSSRTRGADAVDAAAFCARRDRRAGYPRERSTASGRETMLRTAKSCGPDAPTLASSWRSCVGPTGLRQNISADDGGKRARSPGRARNKS
jgi:hypothetical protein